MVSISGSPSGILVTQLLASRDILIEPHAHPTTPASNDILTTVYYTLLTNALRTIPQSQHATLSVDTLTGFIKSILESLPSCSSPNGQSQNATTFGELLVDLIWSADAEIDEVEAEAEVKGPAESNTEQAAMTNDKGTGETVTPYTEALKAKEQLAALVKNLIVRSVPRC